MAASVGTPKLASSSCCWTGRDKRLSLDKGSKKSDIIIPLLLPFGRRIPCPLRVYTFRRPSFAEKVLSSCVIMIIGFRFGLPTAQSCGYSFGNIEPSLENSTKYDKSAFISSRNVFLYSTISSHSWPLKKTLFCTSFYLYPKRLSNFRAVLEQIPVRRSTSPFKQIVLPDKIDYSSPSGVSSSSCPNSGRFARKYLLTN